jgi:RimJ/RimL family protein N-acetyltransferase
MIFRDAGGRDLDRVMTLMVADPASVLTPRTYRFRSRNREYRPAWTWLAEESTAGDRRDQADQADPREPREPPLAAAVWWGDPRESRPAALDGLWVREPVPERDRAGLAARLLDAAHGAYARAGAEEPPAYHIFLTGDWRDRPDAVAALAWREEAARRAGLTTRLERLRFEWTASRGVPSKGRRLTFRPEPDDEVFADLFARVLAGTLDATSRNEAARIGTQTQARKDVAFYRDQMHGDRSWWRVAQAPDGQIAGFGIPSRNTEYAVVGYLGVLPGQRGRGYVDEILAEITGILAAEAGATVIHADTDLENRPMAAAFERAGYRNFGRRLVLSAR